jgi:crotonobetainyl-CoA:carnitine CoA-transferase CaiB-like acyl-CoA transferase
VNRLLQGIRVIEAASFIAAPSCSWALGHLGQIAEAQFTPVDRGRMGNQIFGAFGRDFETRDGRRIMVVAITARQWGALVGALCLEADIGELERKLGVQFEEREGARFLHREALNALVEYAIGRQRCADLAAAFDARGVCWSSYQTLRQAIATDPFLGEGEPHALAARASKRPLSHPRRTPRSRHRRERMSVAVKSPLCAADLGRWRGYIGRSESRHQTLDVESLRRYGVSVGASPEVERTMPPLAHWAFFVDTVDHSMLGTDGHLQRGFGLHT